MADPENALPQFKIKASSACRAVEATWCLPFSGNVLLVINAHSVKMQIPKDPCCSDSSLKPQSKKKGKMQQCVYPDSFCLGCQTRSICNWVIFSAGPADLQAAAVLLLTKHT